MRGSGAILTLALLAAGAAAPAVRAQNAKARVADLEAFFADVEKDYPFFDAKGIRKEWEAAKKPLLDRARKAADDAAFILVVGDAIAALRDGHAFFTKVGPKMPAPEPEWWPGVAFLPATESRVVVMAVPRRLAEDLPCGAVVARIDGKPAREVLDRRGEESWKRGGPFSSPQRARFFEYRLALRGPRGGKHALEIQDGKGTRRVEVAADQKADGWPHTYNLPEGLVQAGKSVLHGRASKDAAYVYLRRIDESVPAGLAAAIAAYPEAKGWIVDLRGNSGGGYDDALLAEVKKLRGGVAALLDAGCVSAGETFARDLKKLAGATLLGETTAGSSTQKKEFRLPSGLATLQYSVKSRLGPDGRPIEFNGIRPDVVVEADPAELRAGKNSAIEQALKTIALTR